MPTRLQITILFVYPLLLLAITVSGYLYVKKQDTKHEELEKKTDTQVQLLASTTASISQSIKIIEENLSSNKNLNDAIVTTLKNEQEKAASFQQELERVTGTVGTLDKLSKTDKELLQKYSKARAILQHPLSSER